MSCLRPHSSAGQSLDGSGTETHGSQLPSGWEVASAPAHVSPTPAFGPGSTSVLRASRECVGGGCSRAVAGPQSRAPWCVLGRGSRVMKQPEGSTSYCRPTEAQTHRETSSGLPSYSKSPEPESTGICGVPRGQVRILKPLWEGPLQWSSSGGADQAQGTSRHSLSPWRPSEAGQVAAGNSGGQSGWAGPGYPPPSLPRL